MEAQRSGFHLAGGASKRQSGFPVGNSDGAEIAQPPGGGQVKSANLSQPNGSPAKRVSFGEEEHRNANRDFPWEIPTAWRLRRRGDVTGSTEAPRPEKRADAPDIYKTGKLKIN
jgi:hypothetical protein